MVIEGFPVVDAIATTPTDPGDRPLQDQLMKSVTVETFGAAYGQPDKLPSSR
jgi:peptidyl-prolyl cis-trans isomerase B (cyclophilin B)